MTPFHTDVEVGRFRPDGEVFKDPRQPGDLDTPITEKGARKFAKSWEFFVGLFFGFFFVITFFYGFFTDVENRVLDRQFRIRGGIPKSDDVVLVFITDDCLTKIASWSGNPTAAQMESWSGDDFFFRNGGISWP